MKKLLEDCNDEEFHLQEFQLRSQVRDEHEIINSKFDIAILHSNTKR